MLFALVANRALEPGSKLAAAGWVTRRAHIDGLAETSDDAWYRAMDWLLDIALDLEREVFWQAATLLDHEVDLLFFDITSTYFEPDEPDAPVARDTHGRQVAGGDAFAVEQGARPVYTPSGRHASSPGPGTRPRASPPPSRYVAANQRPRTAAGGAGAAELNPDF